MSDLVYFLQNSLSICKTVSFSIPLEKLFSGAIFFDTGLIHFGRCKAFGQTFVESIKKRFYIRKK